MMSYSCWLIDILYNKTVNVDKYIHKGKYRHIYGAHS